MWIRTQDKKGLVDVIKVDIARIYGDKIKKIIIWGRFAPDGLFTSNRISLGMYPSMEEAIAEINEIEKAILNDPNGVYHMRSAE